MNKTQKKGGVAMSKQQMLNQQATENQQQGDAIMSKLTQQQSEAMIYFVTFTQKLPSEKAREIIKELRSLYPGKILVFTRKPPSGRKMIVEIAGTLTIITFPYTSRQEAPMRETPRQETPTQVPQSSEGGFTLAELAKVNKVKNKK